MRSFRGRGVWHWGFSFLLASVGCGSGHHGNGGGEVPGDAGAGGASETPGSETGGQGANGPVPDAEAGAGSGGGGNMPSFAPPLDRDVATNLGRASAFLYTGKGAPQKGVKKGVIDPLQVAVVRGHVTGADGKALAGVTVAVLGHAELGYTLTREDGMFDLALNADGSATLTFTLDGFLPVQRTVRTRPQRYDFAEDVALIARDETTSSVTANAAEPQVARGSVVKDADGERQATVAFRAETEAFAVLADGSEQALQKLTFRATEYTVGERGPAAMPGTLPPTSGYTYALELSVDEAEELDAQHVRFSKPVAFYIDNFLDFPVGETVPVGSYERETGQWLASESGRVVQVTAVTDGVADVDVDGDGNADDESALADLGIEEEELRQLGGLYRPGQSLWRAELDHFSAWDFNWPFGPPSKAKPSGVASNSQTNPDNPKKACGSVIHCESQVLGEHLGLAGTSLSLVYQTNHTVARQADFDADVVLSGATLPPDLKAIEVEVDIAGQRETHRFKPQRNLSHHFVWDGRDAYGRLLQGQQRADIRVGYVYDGTYNQGTAFAEPSGVPMTGSKTRQEVTLWQVEERALGAWDAAGLGLGGLMLSRHHAYDPNLQVLYEGNGNQRSARSVPRVLQQAYQAPDFEDWPKHLLAAPGGVYFTTRSQVLFRDVQGKVTVVAGTSKQSFSGDGGPATKATLYNPQGLALAPDGSLLVVDQFYGRIRRIAPNGTITTIAGGGDLFLQDADGRPGLEAGLSVPVSIVALADGSVYFTERNGSRVRRLSPDGVLSTVAGGKGSPLQDPDGLVAGPDGSLYFTDTQANRLYRLWPSGELETLADDTDGLNSPGQLAYAADGSILIVQGKEILRYAPGQGVRHFLGGTEPFAIDPALAAEVRSLAGLVSLALQSDGTLYASATERIFRISPAMPSLSSTDMALPSADGTELFIFNGEGRHLATQDATTGVQLLSFDYEGPWLVGIRDQFGAKTAIERDKSGAITSIVSPDGQRNDFTLDDAGRLLTLTDPLGRKQSFAYDDAGLLGTFTDRRGGAHQFGYDDAGRLISDQAPDGFLQTLERKSTPNGYTVSLKTPLGRTRLYSVERTPDGPEVRRFTTPDGLSNERARADVTLDETAADGTKLAQSLAPDPRFAMQVPTVSQSTQTTPSGRTLVTTHTRSFTPADAENPFGVGATTDTTTVAGLSTITEYDPATRTRTVTSPLGRVTSYQLDENGLVTDISRPGLAPLHNEYDARGRVTATTVGTGKDARTTTFTYDEAGFLSQVTDALGNQRTFTLDAAGRVTEVTTKAGTLALSYDEHDNLTALTPPGRKPYSFGFDSADQLISTAEPKVGNKSFQSSSEYTKDRELSQVTRPDGTALQYKYDDAGRLTTTTLPGGQETRAYSAHGQLASITTPEGEVLSLDTDGPLLASTTASGTANGTISYDYDDAWRIKSTAVGNNAPITLAYDEDSFITAAGPVQVTRDPASGRPTQIIVPSAATAFTYNPFGELASLNATFKTNALLQQSYERDALGRIAQLTETIAGTSTTTEFAYDPDGRLTGVSRNGKLRSYSYDPNGNRLSVDDDGATTAATYDAQDRILTYGSRQYSHDLRGNVTQIQDGTATTSLTFDDRDRLTQVTLPNGTTVSYAIDGQGRRIAKKLNNKLIAAYLYDGQLRPRAQVDAKGNVIAEYAYAEGINVPEAILTSGKTYALLRDHIGSVRLVVDVQNGTVAQRLAYDEFGRVMEDTNPGFQPFGFAGGLYDADTGFVHFGAREYDPYVGRWISKDPIRFRGGSDLYSYGRNDPVNLVDPTGHDPSSGGASSTGDGGEEGVASCDCPSSDPADTPAPYTDYNLTAGYGLGVTGGVFVDAKGNVHPYFGGGVVTPGICGSVSTSTSGSVSPGSWSGQFSGSVAGATYAVGYGGGSWFTEEGASYPPTPGASGTVYYTW